MRYIDSLCGVAKQDAPSDVFQEWCINGSGLVRNQSSTYEQKHRCLELKARESGKTPTHGLQLRWNGSCDFQPSANTSESWGVKAECIGGFETSTDTNQIWYFDTVFGVPEEMTSNEPEGHRLQGPARVRNETAPDRCKMNARILLATDIPGGVQNRSVPNSMKASCFGKV